MTSTVSSGTSTWARHRPTGSLPRALARPPACSRLACPLRWQERRRSASARRSGNPSQVDSAVPPMVVMNGDQVTVHISVQTEDGPANFLDGGAENGPLTFEVGAGDVVGNPLFEAMDGAVRGLSRGDVAEVEASGPEWNPDLMFEVPRSHEEVQRLEGRYKATGGLHEGRVVELANGAQAVVLEVSDTSVRLDANGMLAGQKVVLRFEVVDIQRGS